MNDDSRSRRQLLVRSKLFLFALLPLPGCLTTALWRAQPVVALDDADRAEFAVEAVGVGEPSRQRPDEPPPAQGLVLQARRTAGRCLGQLRATPETSWF